MPTSALSLNWKSGVIRAASLTEQKEKTDGDMVVGGPLRELFVPLSRAVRLVRARVEGRAGLGMSLVLR